MENDGRHASTAVAAWGLRERRGDAMDHEGSRRVDVARRPSEKNRVPRGGWSSRWTNVSRHASGLWRSSHCTAAGVAPRRITRGSAVWTRLVVIREAEAAEFLNGAGLADGQWRSARQHGC